ncbi:MAG: hypothetical protein ACYDBB_13085 [Armatimonadota bacterium]
MRKSLIWWLLIPLVLAGIIFVLVKSGTSRAAVSLTRDREQQLFAVIQQHFHAHEALPDSLDSVKEAWKLTYEQQHDAWGREFILVREVKHGVVTYTIQSAGPDGQFDNADDIFGPSLNFTESDQ